MVADVLVEDRKFLSLWTDILKFMQVGFKVNSTYPFFLVTVMLISGPFNLHPVHELLLHEGRQSY